MKTINQLLKVLNDFADSHLQIGSFGSGDISEIEANGAKDGSIMWVSLAGSSHNDTRRTVSFNVLFMDLTYPDMSNQWEVWSDEELKAYDLITYLNDKDNNDSWTDFEVQTDGQLTPFTERFNNDYTGWMITVNIITEYLHDECAQPIS